MKPLDESNVYPKDIKSKFASYTVNYNDVHKLQKNKLGINLPAI